jgi:hypothetical protein
MGGAARCGAVSGADRDVERKRRTSFPADHADERGSMEGLVSIQNSAIEWSHRDHRGDHRVHGELIGKIHSPPTQVTWQVTGRRLRFFPPFPLCSSGLALCALWPTAFSSAVIRVLRGGDWLTREKKIAAGFSRRRWRVSADANHAFARGLKRGYVRQSTNRTSHSG